MKIGKTLALGVAAAALLASVALAQGPGGHGHGGPGPDMLDHLATALNLTAAQKATATQLHTDLEAKATPLMQQSRTQWNEMHALLEGTNPDATELGTKLIAFHATQVQIKALHDDFMTKLSAVLTADQKATLTKMEAHHQQMEADGHPGMPPGSM